MMAYEHPTSHPEDRTIKPVASREISIAYCDAIVAGESFPEEAVQILLSDIAGTLRYPGAL